MWTVARYLPIAPFSLKPTSSTSSGGKTLLVVTPYAVKMALLDVAIRIHGLSLGEELFPLIRDLSITLAPPDDLLVVKTFGKIWRPAEVKESKSQKASESTEEFQERMHRMEQKHQERMLVGQYPHYSTIAFREYVTYQEPFTLALGNPSSREPLPEILSRLLLYINYFGKRGGFVQILHPPQHVEDLDTSFVELTANTSTEAGFHPESTLQMLDDCGHTLTFARANVYNTGERVTLGKDRVLRHVILPYRLTHWSRGYSWYQRIHDEKEEQ